MTKFVHFLRFVDDGSGIWNGSKDSFLLWFDGVRKRSLDDFNLDLTFELTDINEFSVFLDIKYKFVNRSLSTDIYRKPTDANRYLYFSSYHPPHVFRSILYSQALRYRRIINDDVLLSERLDELKIAFKNSGYPISLIDEVIDPIKNHPRVLDYKNKNDLEKSFKVPWVQTFGSGYVETKIKCKELNSKLSLSNTWKCESGPVLQTVARRAPNIKDLLFKRKQLALKPNSDVMVPCSAILPKRKGPKCQCCTMLSTDSQVSTNGVTVNCAGGTCKSSNIIYCAECILCKRFNYYVGKTVTNLHERINSHRGCYYAILRKIKNSSGSSRNEPIYLEDETDDAQILGLHLVFEHGIYDRNAFNTSYKFNILSHVNPATIRKSEQNLIHKLKTLQPYGLNQCNSVGD